MDRGESRNKRKWKMRERKKHPYKKGGRFRTEFGMKKEEKEQNGS